MYVPWWILWGLAFVACAGAIAWGFADHVMCCNGGRSELVYPWGLVIGVMAIATEIVTVIVGTSKMDP